MGDAELVAAFKAWLGPRRKLVLGALAPSAGRSRQLTRLAEAVRARGLGRYEPLTGLDGLEDELIADTGLLDFVATGDVEPAELPWVLRGLVERMQPGDPEEAARVGAVAAASVLGSQLHGTRSGPEKLASTLRWLTLCAPATTRGS